jgi:hypothetical protein
VWGHDSSPSGPAVKAAIRRANNAMLKADPPIALTIRQKQGVLLLEIRAD